MTSKYFAILFILPAVIANINVQIRVTDKQGDQAVELAGTNEDIISDTERESFHLSDNELKNAVDRYFGSRPDDAYVRSPTPWGDLYKSYGWSQVKRILRPVRATVLGVSSQPSIVNRQYLENKSKNPGIFTANIKSDITNSITSSWDKGSNLSVGQEISYGVQFEVASISGSTSVDYTAKWGESYAKEETVTVGSSSGVEVKLEPGQKVVAELYATRGTMKIQVDYEANLEGNTAINYGSTYKGHHFWALDINDVMSAADLSTILPSSEVIQIGFYSNAKISIRNADDYTQLYSIKL